MLRLRANPTSDPYSNEPTGESWAAPATQVIQTLAPAEPRPSGEPTQDARNSITSGWTLYLPHDADVTGKDRVNVRGTVYRVLGDASVWSTSGLVIQCERLEG